MFWWSKNLFKTYPTTYNVHNMILIVHMMTVIMQILIFSKIFIAVCLWLKNKTSEPMFGWSRNILKTYSPAYETHIFFNYANKGCHYVNICRKINEIKKVNE